MKLPYPPHTSCVDTPGGWCGNARVCYEHSVLSLSAGHVRSRGAKGKHTTPIKLRSAIWRPLAYRYDVRRWRWVVS